MRASECSPRRVTPRCYHNSLCLLLLSFQHTTARFSSLLRGEVCPYPCGVWPGTSLAAAHYIVLYLHMHTHSSAKSTMICDGTVRFGGKHAKNTETEEKSSVTVSYTPVIKKMLKKNAETEKVESIRFLWAMALTRKVERYLWPSTTKCAPIPHRDTVCGSRIRWTYASDVTHTSSRPGCPVRGFGYVLWHQTSRS